MFIRLKHQLRAKNTLLGLCLLTLIVGCGTTPPSQQGDGSLVAQQKGSGNNTTSDLSELEKSQYDQAIDYLSQEKPSRAQRILETLGRKHPGNFAVWLNLGTALYQQEKYDRAYEAAQKAAVQQNDVAEVHNLLGLVSIERHQYQEAESHYLKALQLDKNNINVHYNIALLYDIYYQDIPKAYQHYERYLQLNPEEDSATKDWLNQLKYSLERE